MARHEKRRPASDAPPRATALGRLARRQPGPGAGLIHEELQAHGTWTRCGGGWRRGGKDGGPCS